LKYSKKTLGKKITPLVSGAAALVSDLVSSTSYSVAGYNERLVDSKRV
jgi:hypothetical protein